MLHRDMIIHVQQAFTTLYKRRTVLGIDDLKEEWLVSIRDEQPRWVGPEIASALVKHIGKHHSAPNACDRMARLYNEMLKYNWGRGPYMPSVVKELTRTVHAAVVALAEPLANEGTTRRKSDWKGATVACQLIHAFRKILYPDATPTHISDSLWRFLSAATLPIRNQSSRVTNHMPTWYDMLVRYALVESAKLDKPDWGGAHTARNKHPDICATLLAQIQSAERGGLCTEDESDKLREAFGMGARPENQMGADFDCLDEFSLDELLGETADREGVIADSVAGSSPAVRLVSPPKPAAAATDEVTPEKRKRGRPAGSTKKRAGPVLPEMGAEEPIVVEATAIPVDSSFHSHWIEKQAEPAPKVQRFPSALDARKGWRRDDGTLYAYFRVVGGTATRLTKANLAKPLVPPKVNEDDLLCTDEDPLTWKDGAMPHEESSRLFIPVAPAPN